MTADKPSIAKKIAQGLLILAVLLLAFKYFSWNYWKVEDFQNNLAAYRHSPPALNLTLRSPSRPPLRKSFPRNSAGFFYFIPCPELIDPNASPNDLVFEIDGVPHSNYTWLRFKAFTAFRVGEHAFFVPRRQTSLPERARICSGLPETAAALPLLELRHYAPAPETFTLTAPSGAILETAKTSFSQTLPFHLEAHRLYEIHFTFRSLPPGGPHAVRLLIHGKNQAPGAPALAAILTAPADPNPEPVLVLFSPQHDASNPEISCLLRHERPLPPVAAVISITLLRYPRNLAHLPIIPIPVIISRSALEQTGATLLDLGRLPETK